jgi:hypothetical protein
MAGGGDMRKRKIQGVFIGRPRILVDSPVMVVMTWAALRALNRIESEHLRRGGAENGKLVVTYEDFVAAGIHPDSIAPAIRELEALGVIAVTRRGYRNGGTRLPNLYRLTYVNAWDADDTGTHEYQRFQTVETAREARAAARRKAPPQDVEKNFPTPGIRGYLHPRNQGVPVPPPESGGTF